jgi:hypothetical protein
MAELARQEDTHAASIREVVYRRCAARGYFRFVTFVQSIL